MPDPRDRLPVEADQEPTAARQTHVCTFRHADPPGSGTVVTAARIEVAAIPMGVLACGQTLLHLTFCPHRHHRACRQLARAGATVENRPLAAPVAAGLGALARGRPPAAPLVCATYFLERGTDLQRRVWRMLARIPAGETRTYGWIARALGDPRLARAVGNACNRNPLALVLPCHRVVAARGPGGFAGPDRIKRLLLERERGWAARQPAAFRTGITTSR